MRGQCYDGAATVRGSYPGIAKRIKDKNKLALYDRCYAHILNSCVVDVCGKVAPIRNMVWNVKYNLYICRRLFKKKLRNSAVRPDRCNY